MIGVNFASIQFCNQSQNCHTLDTNRIYCRKIIFGMIQFPCFTQIINLEQNFWSISHIVIVSADVEYEGVVVYEQVDLAVDVDVVETTGHTGDMGGDCVVDVVRRQKPCHPLHELEQLHFINRTQAVHPLQLRAEHTQRKLDYWHTLYNIASYFILQFYFITYHQFSLIELILYKFHRMSIYKICWFVNCTI